MVLVAQADRKSDWWIATNSTNDRLVEEMVLLYLRWLARGQGTNFMNDLFTGASRWLLSANEGSLRGGRWCA